MSSADIAAPVLSPKPVLSRKSVPPNTIKNLKTGDNFDFRPGNNTPIYITTLGRFTVLGADIIHHLHKNTLTGTALNTPVTLTLSTNYPFGRRLGDTPLRYVVYAALAG